MVVLVEIIVSNSVLSGSLITSANWRLAVEEDKELMLRTPGVAVQEGGSGGGSANPSNNAVGGAGNTPATTPSQGNNGGAC